MKLQQSEFKKNRQKYIEEANGETIELFEGEILVARLSIPKPEIIDATTLFCISCGFVLHCEICGSGFAKQDFY